MDESHQHWNSSSSSSQPLGHGHEGIKFVEEDESSSEVIGGKTPEIIFTQPESSTYLQVPSATFSIRDSKEDTTDDNYTEISCGSSFAETKPKEKKPSPKFRRSAEIVLGLLSRSPSFRQKKSRDQEKTYVKEDGTYCSIPEGPDAKDSDTRRKISGSSSPDGAGKKGDEDEQILEALRQVVRKCTNPDPLKRPSSSDIFDHVSFYEKSS